MSELRLNVRIGIIFLYGIIGLSIGMLLGGLGMIVKLVRRPGDTFIGGAKPSGISPWILPILGLLAGIIPVAINPYLFGDPNFLSPLPDPTKVYILTAGGNNQHTHNVTLDENGNGRSTQYKDNLDSHSHRITNWIVDEHPIEGGASHSHELVKNITLLEDGTGHKHTALITVNPEIKNKLTQLSGVSNVVDGHSHAIVRGEVKISTGSSGSHFHKLRLN